MKKIQKGFTLVELIVVITILAILGTIAFISLGGYAQDAKNAKVWTDLTNLAKAIDIAVIDGSIILPNITTWGNEADNGVDTSATITVYDSNNNASTGTLLTSNYKVWTVNFTALRQNGDDFLDPENNSYVAAVTSSGGEAYYQLAGQRIEGSGTYTAILKWNYIAQAGDSIGLISAKNTTTDPIINGEDLGDATTDLY